MVTQRSIPVVRADDPDFAKRFIDASRDIGFVTVRGHGIAPTLFSEMRDLLLRLFDVDEATKREGAISRGNYRGFIPLGFFTPNRLEVNGEQPDLYEGYKLHWECPDLYPPQNAGGRAERRGLANELARRTTGTQGFRLGKPPHK